jgi:hypothetical protein
MITLQHVLFKKKEADIVKAANLSDVHFIDPAKDVGGGLIGPKTSVNYILALFLGILIPLLLYLLFSFINAVQNAEDVSKMTKNSVDRNCLNKESRLSCFDRPKSALSESLEPFDLRYNFIQATKFRRCKTLMITSSVSGEGKHLL